MDEGEKLGGSTTFVTEIDELTEDFLLPSYTSLVDPQEESQTLADTDFDTTLDTSLDTTLSLNTSISFDSSTSDDCTSSSQVNTEPSRATDTSVQYCEDPSINLTSDFKSPEPPVSSNAPPPPFEQSNPLPLAVSPLLPYDYESIPSPFLEAWPERSPVDQVEPEFIEDLATDFAMQEVREQLARLATEELTEDTRVNLVKEVGDHIRGIEKLMGAKMARLSESMCEFLDRLSLSVIESSS